jgi:hypothetical protein
MVSNVLNLRPEELLAALKRFSESYADDPEYVALRSELPPDWPI